MCEVDIEVHGVDADGNVLIRRKLKRRYVTAFFEPADLGDQCHSGSQARVRRCLVSIARKSKATYTPRLQIRSFLANKTTPFA